MAEKPSSIKEWATSESALIQEPNDAQKRTGFGVEQPSVNVFNWVLNNVYRWIDYLDGDDDTSSSTGTSSFTHEHKTARPRIQLPFSFSSLTSKLEQIEVFKRSESSVGGIGGTNYEGTEGVTYTPPSQTPSSLSYTTKSLDLSGYNLSSESVSNTYLMSSGFADGDGRGLNISLVASLQNAGSDVGYGSFFSDNFYASPADGACVFFLITVEAVRHRAAHGVRTFNTPAFSTPSQISSADGGASEVFANVIYFGFLGIGIDGRLHYATITVDDDIGSSDSVRNQIIAEEFNGQNDIFLIMGNSASGISNGECIVWDVSQYSKILGGGDPAYEDRTPVYKNLTPSVNMTRYQIANSYTASGEDIPASIDLDDPLALSGTPSYSLTSLSYTGTTLSLSMTGTPLAATTFHSLRIQRNNVDVFSGLFSEATFATGTYSFTTATNPLAATGNYKFIFSTAGSGVAAFVWTQLETGLAVENYGETNVDFLNISTGVDNDQVILVRKK